jgi:hypothetical protein
MGQIKQAIRDRAPDAARLIFPTLVTDRVDFPENQLRRQQFQALLAKSYIGGQYELLARLADFLDIAHLELGVHNQDKAALFLREVLVNEGGRHCLPQNLPDPNLRLFERFDFPLFGMTKLQMQELADSYGWRDIMEITWFCYKPTRLDEPCGICNPCTYAIEDGMGRRMPIRARIRRRFFLWLRPIAKFARRCARLAVRPHLLKRKRLEAARLHRAP